MGLVMKKVKIDSRLEADSAFWDFFADYYTKKKEEEAKKLLEEERIAMLDDSFDIRDAMGDEEFVSEAYKEYKKGNA